TRGYGDTKRRPRRAWRQTGSDVKSHPIRGPPRAIPMFVQLTKAFLGKPAGERIDVSEEDAKSLVAQQLAVPVTDDLITPAVSKALESAFTKFTQSLDGIINASLKAFADAQGQAKKHAVPLIFGEANTGDPKKSFGDFCLAVARKDSGYLEKH